MCDGMQRIWLQIFRKPHWIFRKLQPTEDWYPHVKHSYWQQSIDNTYCTKNVMHSCGASLVSRPESCGGYYAAVASYDGRFAPSKGKKPTNCQNNIGFVVGRKKNDNMLKSRRVYTKTLRKWKCKFRKWNACAWSMQLAMAAAQTRLNMLNTEDV